MSHEKKLKAAEELVIVDPATGHFIQGGKIFPRQQGGVTIGGVSYTAHKSKAQKFPTDEDVKAFIQGHGLKGLNVVPFSEA